MIDPSGILKNETTGRYHPILFRPAPRPGDAQLSGGFSRWKSRAHHTEGFDTLEAATAEIQARGWTAVGAVWAWDGTGIPAMTRYFQYQPEIDN